MDLKLNDPARLIPLIVASALFMENLDSTIIATALPAIARSLREDPLHLSLAISSYLLSLAVFIPVSGWMADRYGARRVFRNAIVVFVLGSVACAASQNIGELILARVAQGIGGAMMVPVGRLVLLRQVPKSELVAAMSYLTIPALMAPIFGPPLGGFIVTYASWRWIFLINVPTGIILFFLISSMIKEKAPERDGKRPGVDWFGFGFVALGLGCLQVVMDRGQQDDWFASGFITALTLISVLALISLVWWELRDPHPMVDLRLLANRDFAVSFVLMGVLGFMLLGSTYLIPAYVQSLMGYRAVDAGMVLTPGGIVIIMLMPIIGRILNKFDLRLLVAIGLTVGGLSLVWMDHFYLDASFKVIMLARMAQASAMAFLFIPVNILAFRGIPKDKTNNASALVNLARNFGGSIGISFASTLVTRREQFHQSRLTEHLQNLNPNYPDFASQLGSLTGSGAADSAGTLANVYQGVIQQATLLAYLDDFKIVGLVFLAMLPLLLLLKPGKGGGGPVPGH